MKEAYWQVPFAPRFWKYLSFGVGDVTYQFSQMPFSFTIAQLLFTKMTKVLANKLAAKGLWVLVYLDDWLVSAPSPELLQSAVTTVGYSLKQLPWDYWSIA